MKNKEIYTSTDRTLDIKKYKVVRETDKMYFFNEGDTIRRKSKKNCFNTEVEALENALEFIDYTLKLSSMSAYEVYNLYKKIEKKYPEVLI